MMMIEMSEERFDATMRMIYEALENPETPEEMLKVLTDIRESLVIA